MARYKPIEQGQGYFITIYPEAIFDDNSIEKVIDKFIDDFADTSKFDLKYNNDTAGQRAISPKVKLKLIIYALSQGIESLRKIDRLLKLSHPAYLFLSGGITVDHSTLSIFVNTFEDEIAGIFSRLLYLLEELGMIDWNRIMIDGTRVSSNASRELTDNAAGFSKKMKRCENLSAKLLARAKYIEQLAEKNEISEKELQKEKDLIAKQQHKYNLTINKLQEYENELKEKENDEVKKKPKPSPLKVNLTDRESKFLAKHGTYVQGYNVQAAFSSNDILLFIEATSQTNDIELLSYMVNNIENLKEKNKVKEKSKYLLDKGYFNIKEMAELNKDDKELYIAPPSHFTKSWFINEEHRVIEENGDKYLLCKGGHKRKAKFKKSDRSYEFLMKRSICETCDHFTTCFENQNKKKDKKEKQSRVFSLSEAYVENKEFWFKYRDRVKTEEWIYNYNKRIGKEHNFFDIKYNNGLKQLNFRGKKKCNSMALMSGTSYNLKKLQKNVCSIGWDEIKKIMNT